MVGSGGDREMMTVAQLRDLLRLCDPDATVRIVPDGTAWEPANEGIVYGWLGVLRDGGKRTVTLFTRPGKRA